jgi:hypothetical protein
MLMKRDQRELPNGVLASSVPRADSEAVGFSIGLIRLPPCSQARVSSASR